MALNLDDNKRPYSPNLGLNETFDEISAAVNALENQLPSSASTLTVQAITLSSQPADIVSTANTINVLTVDANGTIAKKKKSNAKVWRGIFSQTGTAAPTAIVLENDLTGTITWSRTDGGGFITYIGTLTGQFNANRTFINGHSTFAGNKAKVDVFTDLAGAYTYVYIDAYGDNAFSIQCFTAAGGVPVEWSTAIGTTPYFLDIVVYQD